MWYKDDRIIYLEENEKKNLEEIEDLKYKLRLFYREIKRQDIRNENINDSTHLTQSPICEKLANDNQDLANNKSMLEDLENMMNITDENEVKFYKENNIPKLKSFIYLLKEFGLDSYTFFNISIDINY